MYTILNAWNGGYLQPLKKFIVQNNEAMIHRFEDNIFELIDASEL
jgi:hypothetical protein